MCPKLMIYLSSNVLGNKIFLLIGDVFSVVEYQMAFYGLYSPPLLFTIYGHYIVKAVHTMGYTLQREHITTVCCSIKHGIINI